MIVLVTSSRELEKKTQLPLCREVLYLYHMSVVQNRLNSWLSASPRIVMENEERSQARQNARQLAHGQELMIKSTLGGQNMKFKACLTCVELCIL